MAESLPLGLTVRLPFSTPEEFLQRSGLHLTQGGLFLSSTSPRPPGTAMVLDLQLQGGARLLKALTVVAWVTGMHGDGVPGMGLTFIAVDAAGRRFLRAATAAMPHARSRAPPVPAGVGVPDASPGAATEPPKSAAEVAGPGAQVAGPASTPEQPVRGPAFVATALGPRTGPIIGIDLGTTNTCAAVVLGTGAPTLLRREGQAVVPSVVALSARGTLLVGGPARNQLFSAPRSTVWGFKRLLGRPAESPDVREASARFPWVVVPSETGECAVRLGDRTYPLEQLSALVLGEVKAVAESRLGAPVHRAVISVPAWYAETQRNAVREAGRLAGLHVERVVNEPTAAALAWGATRRRPGRVLVYDLGGGTFDASVLELAGAVHEVVCAGGDAFLGGLDFDAAVVAWALSQFERQHGVRPSDPMALARVLDAAERAKIALSDRARVRLQVPFVTEVGGRPVDLDLTLDRAQLEALTRPLVDRTLAVCRSVLAERTLRPDQIDEVILVGGQSRAPLVHERVTALFGREPVTAGNPEELVALGAALLGASLDHRAGVVLIDVLPHAIGVALPGGHFHAVIPRNTPLPTRRAFTVATTRDRQERLELTILQGDATLARENAWLGRFVIEALPPAPRGGLSLELSFELDQEGLLTLSATESLTGRIATSRFATRDAPAVVRERLAALEAEGAEEGPFELGRWVRGLFGEVSSQGAGR